MPKEVIMPKFGFTQEESEIVTWLVAEGDAVEAGDPLAEVTTDKIDMEVEAPVDGIVAGVRYRAGDVVPVTEVIAFILAPGESLPTPEPALDRLPAPAKRPATDRDGSPGAKSGRPVTPVAARVAAAQGVDLATVRGSGSGGKITRADVEQVVHARHEPERESPPSGKIRATPAARRLARQTGVTLAHVAGSGPAGRIQAADVASAQPQPPAREASPPSAGVTRIPLSRMRRTIALGLGQSWRSAPHINFSTTVDVTNLQALADRASAEGPRVSLTAALVQTVAWALRRHPRLNSHLIDDEIIEFEAVHMGIAVALEDGLIVPVVHDANRAGLHALADRIRDVARRAREGRLKPEELQGATFSLSNLGMFGIDAFTAIINPPQVGILAAGSVRRSFVPDEADRPVVRPLLTLTLAVDHRAVDGADAARYMADLKTAIEQPDRMLY